jgi:predicted nuclease of predicted toxin-antitoxin system
VKLLFDENLSFRLVAQLDPVFSGSAQVDSVGLHSQTDLVIWSYARDEGFAIVSKDDDFRQLAVLHGAPPKVIWLSVGNADTNAIATVINDRRFRIEAFIRDSVESLLILELPERSS